MLCVKEKFTVPQSAKIVDSSLRISAFTTWEGMQARRKHFSIGGAIFWS